MELKRRVYEELLTWRCSALKKALFVIGARQVGKSFLVRKLGREQYKNFIELNLLKDSDATRMLLAAANLDDLLSRITLITGKQLAPGQTLIFFDEIQEAPDLLTWAKFIADDRRFDVAYSGSMLGIVVKGVRSFPVGYAKTIKMYPLDFEEFCRAQNVPDLILEQIRASAISLAPLEQTLHDAMMSRFRTYVVVGGMPDAVCRFLESGGDFATVREVQTDLVDGYKFDIAKYAGTRAPQVRAIFDKIPSELDRDSKRFLLADLNKNARYNRYKNDFAWLTDASVALKVNHMTDIHAPLAQSLDSGYFKLYQSDTGMLVSRYAPGVALNIYAGMSNANLGGIYENVVAQGLNAQGLPLNYFSTRKFGEVDFIVPDTHGVPVPIEVKSGRSPKLHATLSKMLASPEYGLARGIVLSRLNFDKNNKVIYLPLYAQMFLQDSLA